MTGTETSNPAASAATARLRKWALTEGNALFQFGTEGSFDRCVSFYADKLPPGQLHGWCANLQHMATGVWPGHKNDAAHPMGPAAGSSRR